MGANFKVCTGFKPDPIYAMVERKPESGVSGLSIPLAMVDRKLS
jgi:hypothetical protein